jgi:hypothetical protein
MINLVLLGIGGAAGFAVGYLTRPTLLGVKVPLEIMSSTHPMDAQFRQEMMTHMAVSTAAGAAIAIALIIAIALLQGQRAGGGPR